MQKNNKVDSEINLIKIPENVKYAFELDQETDWVKEILLEMNEHATDKSPELNFQETTLLITGEIEKKTKVDMGEFLIAKGMIQADYVTECVRTLKPMTIQLDVPFKICFVDEAMSTTELFADLDETYVENDVYELYFYTKRTVNFRDMIHEQIFLHYDQYPILDAESKLDGLEG